MAHTWDGERRLGDVGGDDDEARAGGAGAEDAGLLRTGQHRV